MRGAAWRLPHPPCVCGEAYLSRSFALLSFLPCPSSPQYLRDPADVPTALRWGAAVGALCVSRAGACETPLAAEEVRAVLECGAVRRSADVSDGCV